MAWRPGTAYSQDLVIASSPDTIDLPIYIATSNQMALPQMCEEGMGIACLFYADVQPALERGALMRVLPRWSLVTSPVTTVTSKRDGVQPKVCVAMIARERQFTTLPKSHEPEGDRRADGAVTPLEVRILHAAKYLN